MSSLPNNLVAAARQKWLADEHEAALRLFREAAKSSPDDVRLAVEFASYLGMRFEVEEASALLQHCEEQLKDNAEGSFQVGLAFERAFLPERALRCFQNAVRNAPDHYPSWLKIAAWFDRRGMLDQAIDAIEPSLTELATTDLPKDLPEVRLARAQFHRRQGEITAAEAMLEKLTLSSISDVVRVEAWYELAGLYDISGRAELAFAAATSAKALQKRQAAPHLKQAQELARLETSFVTTVTSNHYERWSSDASHPPLALLTGSPRSGTTLMARALGNHASIDLADEVNVYATYVHREMLRGMEGTNAGDALDAIPNSHLAECQSRYLRWLRAAIHRQQSTNVLLDKNPSTTFLIPAFRRLFPKAAIIMAIRDPRDVVVSCYLQHFPLNPVSAMFTRFDYAVMRCRAEIEAWLRLRERLTQPWCEVRYEELTNGNEEVLKASLLAMGLDWQGDLLSFASSLRTNAVRSPTYAQLFAPVHTQSIGRWQRYEKQLRPYMSQLEPICHLLGYE